MVILGGSGTLPPREIESTTSAVLGTASLSHLSSSLNNMVSVIYNHDNILVCLTNAPTIPC